MSRFWILSKIGHFSGFFILDCLLLNLFRERKVSLLLSILFAIVTELAQLFVGRDGRIYDMVIDSSGALLAYYRLNGIQNMIKRFLSAK
jgi:VanZ family protein